MKKTGLVIGLLLMMGQWVMAQSTPTADEILDKYITAIGGKDALMKVTDMTTNMSSEANGNVIMITRKQKMPAMFSMVINANGMEVMKQTGDGTKVAMGGMQGSRTLDGPAAQQMTLMNTLFPELHYAENGVKSTLVGPEKVDAQDTWKLSHTTADGATTWTDNFDTKTGLKVQSVATGRGPQGEAKTTSMYSDYKETGGIKFPMTMVQQSPRGPMTMSVDNVKINKGLKDSDFTVK